MKFTVEEGRSLQANAYLMADLFQEYHFVPPSASDMADAASGEHGSEGGSSDKNNKDAPVQPYCFRINFSVMWECLAMFTTSVAYTALQIAYGGYGSALFLLLEEGNLSTNCSIRTLDNAEHMPVLSMTDAIAEVIMDSELLKDAFAELDWSSETAQLLLSPHTPFFRLSSEGRPGSCVVEYPMNTQLFRKFRCRQEVSANYRMSILLPTVKALAMAQLTQIQINARGHLKLQHMIQTEDKKQSFVDFYLMPEEATMEDDENDTDDGKYGLLGTAESSMSAPMKQSPSTTKGTDLSSRAAALIENGFLNTPENNQPAMTDGPVEKNDL